jgi:hypothetical protein
LEKQILLRNDNLSVWWDRYVEDDPVLRAIPYFGDNDKGRLDFLERGFESIIDQQVSAQCMSF